jgi:hypothetical protein
MSFLNLMAMFIFIVKYFNINSISDLLCFFSYHALYPRISPDLKATAKSALGNLLFLSAKDKGTPVSPFDIYFG